MNEHDKKHLLRLASIAKMVERIYDAAADDAAAIAAEVVRMGADGKKPFDFADYPGAKAKMDELLAWLRSQLEVVVVNGVASEWQLSEDKNDNLLRSVLGMGEGDDGNNDAAKETGEADELPGAVRRRWMDRNEKAREAFLKRKERGMGLSERVWKATETIPNEMAMGIDMSILDGKPAAAMARDLKQYLKFPDKLFRRVRDERGILHLSKNAAAFHPGQGVYRSSYQNARRLAVTETNMAYRTADHERWQKLDFVVGIEIHLSGNHTCKGRDGKPHRFTDICDQLAGKYPKDFKFTGWHPHCRCYATTILKTEDEIDADMQKIMAGEEVTGESVNKVTEPPEGFSKWVDKNEERIATARKNGTLPGFLRENSGYVGVKDEAKASNTPIKAAPAKSEQTRSTDIHDLKDTAPPAKSIGDLKIEKEDTVEKAKQKYNSYDENWNKLYFNEENGGYNVSHKKHQFSNNKAEKEVIVDGKKIKEKSKMTGGEAEKYVCRVLAEKRAKQIELLPENGVSTGKPDMSFDKKTWDVKYIPKANQNTIRKCIEDAKKAECAIFYWDEKNQLEDLKIAIERTIGKYEKKGKLKSLPSVFYMNNEGELRCLFDNS